MHTQELNKMYTCMNCALVFVCVCVWSNTNKVQINKNRYASDNVSKRVKNDRQKKDKLKSKEIECSMDFPSVYHLSWFSIMSPNHMHDYTHFI